MEPTWPSYHLYRQMTFILPRLHLFMLPNSLSTNLYSYFSFPLPLTPYYICQSYNYSNMPDMINTQRIIKILIPTILRWPYSQLLRSAYEFIYQGKPCSSKLRNVPVFLISVIYNYIIPLILSSIETGLSPPISATHPGCSEYCYSHWF